MRKTKSVSQIIAAHTLTYFNFLNLCLFVLILMSGQFKNMLFMGVVISNSFIGIVQELRVKKLIDKLSVLTATKARRITYDASRLSPKALACLYDGRCDKDEEAAELLKTILARDPVEVSVEEICVHDIVRLSSGDQISCDGIVLSSDGMEVDESMLTGESLPVHKNAGDELFSGSHIVAGSGVSIIIHTGDDNYAEQLMMKARTKKRASSEMQYAINRIIHYVSYAIVPIGIALFCIQFFRVGATMSDSIVNTVAGVLGMIPEGLVLLTSISFILGVGRLAGKRALVQEMEAIEALARVSTLCLDKTGTITTGALRVEKLIRINEEDRVVPLLEGISHAFNETNVTGEALKSYFEDTKPYPVVSTLPFSSRRKYMGVEFEGEGCFLLGAPDFITKEEQIIQKSEEYATKGYRVLLLAKAESLAEVPEELSQVEPLGLVVLSDCVKDDAPDTLKFFREMGVRIRILSGDNPATVSAVAKMAGLEGAERYIDATTLPTDQTELKKVAANYTVFGRVSPEMKYELIRAFQQDSVVGMVGDGVNDVLALKEADCSIAMANGADAARQTAHIVLTDSNFSSMKNIVSEGRTIIANIERVSALYLTKTIYSMLLCVIFIIIGKSYPFIPIQLSLIGATAIGIPSFLLALEQHEEPVISGFMKHVLRISLPGAIGMAIVTGVVQILDKVLALGPEAVSTLNMYSGGLVSLGVLAFVCMPFTKRRIALCVGMTLLFVGACLMLPSFFGVIAFF